MHGDGDDLPDGRVREEIQGLDREAIVAEFLEDALDEYGEKESELEGMEAGLMRELERYVILQVVDTRWREHLENMDYLREGVHLRAMAQKDPLVEYRAEGHVMFEELGLAIREEVVTTSSTPQLAPEDASTIQALQEAEATDGDLDVPARVARRRGRDRGRGRRGGARSRPRPQRWEAGRPSRRSSA